MQLSKHLGDRHFWSYSLRLAVPISIQNILVCSFTLLDTIMIGVLGDTALAAVGMAGQWAWLLNLVMFGFNSGAGVFIAQYWGVRDIDRIRKSFGLAAVSALSVSLLFTLVALFAPHVVLSIFTSDPDVAALGEVYLRCACFSYVAICLNNLFGTLLRSTEQVKLPLYVSMVSVVMNAVLNALFIHALQMGIKGAAIATSISSWISPLLLLFISIKRKNILRAPIRAFVGWTKDFAKKYYLLSLPALANESLWSLGTLIYKAIYSNTSTDFYAAYTIFTSIQDIIFAFFIGLCHASSVIVGKKVGAGDLREAYQDARRFTFVFPLFTIAVSLVFMLLRPVLLLPFPNSDAATLATASTLLIYYLCELPLRNIPYITIVGIFRAGGDTKIGLLYDTIGLWLLAIPAVWLGARVLHLNLTMVFLIMLLIEDVPKSALCLMRLFSRKWIRPVTDQGESALEDTAAGI